MTRKWKHGVTHERGHLLGLIPELPQPPSDIGNAPKTFTDIQSSLSNWFINKSSAESSSPSSRPSGFFLGSALLPLHKIPKTRPGIGWGGGRIPRCHVVELDGLKSLRAKGRRGQEWDRQLSDLAVLVIELVKTPTRRSGETVLASSALQTQKPTQGKLDKVGSRMLLVAL